MKNIPSVKAILAIIAIILINILTINIINDDKSVHNNHITIMNKKLLNGQFDNLIALDKSSEEEIVEEIVYENMTMDELAAKLEKNLKSTLKGYGRTFAEYSIYYGVDPYISLAIVLHETGCASGKCSSLASKCNNIGGMKGSPGCGGGAYKKFATLDQGIKAFYKNLSNNYFKKGLNTPEKIGKKYAESTNWASRVNYYIKKIKNS